MVEVRNTVLFSIIQTGAEFHLLIQRYGFHLKEHRTFERRSRLGFHLCTLSCALDVGRYYKYVLLIWYESDKCVGISSLIDRVEPFGGQLV